MDFCDYEDPLDRKQGDVPIGLLLRRTYNVPTGMAEALYPDRGDLLPGTSGLLGARLLHRQRHQPKQKGTHERKSTHAVLAVWIQPEALAGVAAVGTYQEIRGSRNPANSQSGRQALCLGVASDLVNVPDRGDAYPGNSDTLTMRCVKSEYEMDTVPGLYFVQSWYRAFRTTED